MPPTPKTAIRLTTLPPELCTRKDIRAILGIAPTVRALQGSRFRNLRYAEVILNNRRTFVYNRAEIEALKYPAPPRNYINAVQAAQLLGYTHITKLSHANSIRLLLTKHNIPSKIVRCHHSYQVWHTPSIRVLKKKLKHQTSNIKH